MAANNDIVRSSRASTDESNAPIPSAFVKPEPVQIAINENATQKRLPENKLFPPKSNRNYFFHRNTLKEKKCNKIVTIRNGDLLRR